MDPGIQTSGIHRFSSGANPRPDADHLVIEEPLEIVVTFRRRKLLVRKPVSITMRTPGMDRELAVGFLYSEGILHSTRPIADVEQGSANSVTVALDGEIDLGRLERHFYISSSCGVCGKTSLEALRMNRVIHLPGNTPQHVTEFLYKIPELVRHQQSMFDFTGGLHAAALFETTQTLIRICEDVGRHNAVDKVIGAELLAGRTDFSSLSLFVSGRAGFELVQKALMAGIPFMAAVGAPSSLSVELARQYGMTLVGFLKQNRFNLYSGISRVYGL
jgi:FdhD protein